MKEKEFARIEVETGFDEEGDGYEFVYGSGPEEGSFMVGEDASKEDAESMARDINAAHEAAVKARIKEFAEKAAKAYESGCSSRRHCRNNMKCQVCRIAAEIRKLAEEFK